MDTAAPWIEKLVAVTGWETTRKRVIDWTSVEDRLGVALPTDYKDLAERFGSGAFDGYLQLFTPDTPSGHYDLVKSAAWLGEQAAADEWINALYRPHPVFPAVGGLLQWADSVQADGFYWLTDSAEPDAWPILCQADGESGVWERFDGSTSEFIHRVLTDHRQPFSVAWAFDNHSFESYERIGEPDPGWDADPHW
ncbi:SMI1/KNR4 family protein [Kitasatospora sp. NPDC094011]|uniref:SMI1/KNR4 family protein n=1 Tax=Kitasatospora sp. NPDC094011 TaxID=3364090 RepID=UPI0038101C92